MFFEPIRFGGQSAAATTPKSFSRLLLSVAIFLGAGLGQVHAAASTPASTKVELEGEVRVMIEDHASSSRTRYYLKTDKESLELKPSHAQKRQLQAGAKVRVRGVKSGALLALDGSGGSVTVTMPQPLLNTFGERKMAVLLVNFQDNPVQPYTLADATNVISQTNTFIKENSQNQTSVTGNSFGWYTLPIATTCSSSEIATAAHNAASAAGVDLSGYAHLVYVFPRNTACSWAGLANVNVSPTGSIWVNGQLDLKVVAHELGHNFGLYHSHALECGDSIGGSSCTSVDYGDKFDIMGNSYAAHFNAFQKERLRWVNNGSMPPITTVSASGNYTLSTYETAATGAKALKILKGTDATTGAKTYYYVEFRQAIGADAFLATMSGSNVTNGVLIHTGTDTDINSSYLLDMTPNSTTLNDRNDSALVLGQSFTDPGSGVTITPTTISSTGATVNVTLTQQTPTATCTRANPVITPATQSKSGAAGSALSYTVTVTNKDSSACSASSFNLNAVVPSGWSAGFASATLSLSPGASGSTTLTMTAPTSATGSTNASLSATNGSATSSTGSATATYSVGSTSTSTSYSITAATDKSVYGINKTVAMSSVVKSGTTAVAGASVMFTVTAPNGSVALQNGSTGSTGVATSSYRLNSKAVKGVYQLRTTVSGQSTSGSTSFTVQ